MWKEVDREVSVSNTFEDQSLELWCHSYRTSDNCLLEHLQNPAVSLLRDE